jgi:hypothetical protein
LLTLLGWVCDCCEVFLALGPPKSRRNSAAVAKVKVPIMAALSTKSSGSESNAANSKLPGDKVNCFNGAIKA